MNTKRKETTLASVLAGLPHSFQQTEHAKLLNQSVAGVTSDSRQVGPGWIFVAIQGTSQDGHQFAEEAINRGACLLIVEKELPHLTVPILKVNDGREALARLAANFYHHPSQALLMVGITGTSGKTTTSYLIESILKSAGHQVGVIGTINIRYPGREVEASQTTPGADELQQLLANMKAAGCTAVVMEVSSHALAQKRVDCIAFDAVAFTNLSPEHQDFHPDMEDYYQTKALLFTHHLEFAAKVGKKPVAVIHAGDPYGRRLLASSSFRSLSFSLDDQGKDWSIGIHGIQGTFQNVRLESPLIGRFNAENVLTALMLAEGLGISAENAARGISACPVVPGRLERVQNSKGIHVFVDYAHKPDALEKVLITLRNTITSEPRSARLITVFGCGGDRDRTKRPVMGRLAATLSDLVWVTSDNPRSEEPGAIIEEIVLGMAGHSNYQVEPDRKNAIEGAIRAARPGDLVLIAGKGHENYQIVSDPAAEPTAATEGASPGPSVRSGPRATKTRKIHFDDREVALHALT